MNELEHYQKRKKMVISNKPERHFSIFISPKTYCFTIVKGVTHRRRLYVHAVIPDIAKTQRWDAGLYKKNHVDFGIFPSS